MSYRAIRTAALAEVADRSPGFIRSLCDMQPGLLRLLTEVLELRDDGEAERFCRREALGLDNPTADSPSVRLAAFVGPGSSARRLQLCTEAAYTACLSELATMAPPCRGCRCATITEQLRGLDQQRSSRREPEAVRVR